MLAGGIVFELPVFLLALIKMGITTPAKLRKNRRYAVLVIAVLAALLPTIDPVTMLLEMVPLLLLYELSIVLCRFFVPPETDMADPVAPAEGS
jgi:sec-independent protein translocase protein TatC